MKRSSAKRPTGQALDRENSPSSRRRQNEIMDAAAKVFAKQGFHGTSTQDIADVLGIRQASLYYYFTSKEMALELVCLKGVEGFLEDATDIASRSISPTEQISLLIEAHLRALAERQDFVRTFLTERQYLPKLSRRKVGKISRAYESVIERVIASGIAKSEFAAHTHPRVLTLALLGLCKSVATWHGYSDHIALPKVAEAFSTILLRGIELKP